jgi:hypothetical protein
LGAFAEIGCANSQNLPAIATKNFGGTQKNLYRRWIPPAPTIPAVSER